jgi:hypothetical protein
MDEYNELRRGLGMAPAGGNDLSEFVAFVVVSYLLADAVVEECERLPDSERPLFMITYATYLKWLAMLFARSKFPPGSSEAVSVILDREFAKQHWFQPEAVRRIYEMMTQFPPLEAKGELGVTLPWGGAVQAANDAGFKLADTVDVKWHVYVSVVTTKLFESLGEIAEKVSEKN